MLKRLLPLLLLFLSTWTLAEPLRTGLVLSGGGARGLAHIGVLKQLEEMNIPIDAIAEAIAGLPFPEEAGQLKSLLGAALNLSPKFVITIGNASAVVDTSPEIEIPDFEPDETDNDPTSPVDTGSGEHEQQAVRRHRRIGIARLRESVTRRPVRITGARALDGDLQTAGTEFEAMAGTVDAPLSRDLTAHVGLEGHRAGRRGRRARRAGAGAVGGRASGEQRKRRHHDRHGSPPYGPSRRNLSPRRRQGVRASGRGVPSR